MVATVRTLPSADPEAAARPVATPARVARLLARTPDGPAEVLHRAAGALYLIVPGAAPPSERCLGVVAPGAARVPIALRLARPDRVPDLAVTTRVEVRSHVVLVDGVRLHTTRHLVAPDLPRTGAWGPGEHTRARRTLATLLPRIGAGPGLTPEQDDVLAGYLAVAGRFAGPAWASDVRADLRPRLAATTTLSAALLLAALDGDTVPEFAAWWRAVGGEREPAAAARLAALGHTSGAALLHGGRLALGVETAVAA